MGVPAFELIEAAPLTLGVEIKEGRFVPIIPRNTPLPAVKTGTFFTSVNYQTSVAFEVLLFYNG